MRVGLVPIISASRSLSRDVVIRFRENDCAVAEMPGRPLELLLLEEKKALRRRSRLRTWRQQQQTRPVSRSWRQRQMGCGKGTIPRTLHCRYSVCKLHWFSSSHACLPSCSSP